MYIETMDKLFFNAYIECALWSSVDNNDEPLDSNYSISDFDNESFEKLKKYSIDFFTDNIDLINKAKNYSYEQCAHDLWLTQNGHGAGFWDRNLNNGIGEKLTKLCENNQIDLYVGDNNKIYAI